MQLVPPISGTVNSFITYYGTYETHSSFFETFITQRQLEMVSKMTVLVETLFLLIPFIVIVSSHSGSTIQIGRIPVDAKGRPLEKGVDECKYVRTIGTFDLLDCPMDGKQIFGVFQHILCEYNYDQNQMNQINLCIQLAVSRYLVDLLIK